MSGFEGAGRRIVDEVTSWPGMSADWGSRGELSLKLGRREIGHLHGDHAVHLGFPKAVWHELSRPGPDRLPPRLPRKSPATPPGGHRSRG